MLKKFPQILPRDYERWLLPPSECSLFERDHHQIQECYDIQPRSIILDLKNTKGGQGNSIPFPWRDCFFLQQHLRPFFIWNAGSVRSISETPSDCRLLLSRKIQKPGPCPLMSFIGDIAILSRRLTSKAGVEGITKPTQQVLRQSVWQMKNTARSLNRAISLCPSGQWSWSTNRSSHICGFE